MVVRFLVGFLVRFPALAGSFGVGPRSSRVAAWGQVCPLAGGGSGRACTCRAGSRWRDGRPMMGGGRLCSGTGGGPSWCARAGAKRWFWARCGSWWRCEAARGARDRAAAGRAVGGRGDGGPLASTPPPLRWRARGRRGGGFRGVACRRGHRGAAVVSGAGGQRLGGGGACGPGAPRSWPARLPMGRGVGLLPVGRGVGVVGGHPVLSYTLGEESGGSLQAAGWREVGQTRGGQWACPSRARAGRGEVAAAPKTRWAPGWALDMAQLVTAG